MPQHPKPATGKGGKRGARTMSERKITRTNVLCEFGHREQIKRPGDGVCPAHAYGRALTIVAHPERRPADLCARHALILEAAGVVSRR